MIFQRKEGITTLMGLITFVILILFFVYWAIMSVEVFGVLGYQQINFHLFFLVILIAVGASFQSIDRLDLSLPHRRWISAILVTNRELIILGLLMFGVVFVTKDQAISRIFLSSFLAGTWLVLVLLNRYAPEILQDRVFSGQNAVRLALVGQSRTAEGMASWLERARGYGLNVLGLVETVPRGENHSTGGVRILGRFDELSEIIEKHNLTHIMLIDHREGENWVRNAASVAQRQGTRLWVYNFWNDFFDRPLITDNFQGQTYFTLHDEPLEDPMNRILKRAFDVVVSLAVILFVLAPLCLVVGAAQRIQSPGPLFYRQRRLGRLQRPFYVYKFRSMRVDHGGDESRQATRDDDRIYPFARFLRRTSLDEIPQFINVLRSEMSVVGPRPHLDKHDEAFAQIIEFYKTRNYIKPGITGLAQTQGYRGEITDPEQLRQRIRFDVEYINTWSLWLDTWLVIKTAKQVLRPPESAR